MSNPEICILGAGFAALTAVRELRKHAPDARITLIAPRPEFIYLPSLIWIPTGLRRGDDLRIALQPFFVRHAVNYVQARVTAVLEGGRRVVTDAGEYSNDALIVASGGRFIKKLPGIEHAITLCEGITAAERIRERILAMEHGRIALGFGGNPAEPSAMRGGPMFELLFGLERWLRRQKRRDRIDLTFFNAAAEPGKRLGERAVKSLLAEMGRRRIDTHLGHKPLGFSETGVDTDGGHINADLILRPFHQKGAVVSLREFTNNATNHHHGMESVERFGVEMTGTADFDQDGVEDELSVGDITAQTLYQAALAVPGQVLPDDIDALRAVFYGEREFENMGCTDCHTPSLKLSSRYFTEPNPYNPAGNLRPEDVDQLRGLGFVGPHLHALLRADVSVGHSHHPHGPLGAFALRQGAQLFAVDLATEHAVGQLGLLHHLAHAATAVRPVVVMGAVGSTEAAGTAKTAQAAQAAEATPTESAPEGAGQTRCQAGSAGRETAAHLEIHRYVHGLSPPLTLIME